MDIVFKKYFWVINLIALAVGGLLVGSTINDWLVAKVFGARDGAIEVPNVAVANVTTKVGNGTPIGDDLIFRRPFNADPLPEDEPEPVANNEPEEAEPSEESSDEIEESELDVALIGTLVYPDPAMSMATIKMSGSSKLVRVGTDLEGKAKIIQIERRYLLVVEDGQHKYIRLWESDKGGGNKPGMNPNVPGVRPNANRPTPGPSAQAPAKANWKDGVEKTGENEYQISRAMLDEQLQDLSQLGMQARIVPNYRNGKYEGFKLVGVRPNSLYRAIGIRSGDIIKRINGAEINSPNKAIELFEQFKNSNAISMDVERRGQVQAFQYQIK